MAVSGQGYGHRHGHGHGRGKGQGTDRHIRDTDGAARTETGTGGTTSLPIRSIIDQNWKITLLEFRPPLYALLRYATDLSRYYVLRIIVFFSVIK